MLCSLTMPAEYDVIAAHSPPVFSHSPPRYYSSSYHQPPPQRSTSLPLMSRNGFSRNGLALGMAAVVAVAVSDSPRRPILVTSSSTGELIESDDCAISSEPCSPTKLKKKVVFADDKGLQLEHVRMMTEPSSAPPRWTMQFLAQVTRGVTAEAAPEPWEMKFAQPASDYLAFRGRLDTCNVSLENVIVREAEQVVVGTVKVRNVAFHKEVLIRSSPDKWATHEDAYCTFVNNSVPSSVPVLYDTFSFRITLPPRSRRLEFCVCFRAEHQEFWDNNNGQNYTLVKKTSAGEIDAITDNIKYLLRRYRQPQRHALHQLTWFLPCLQIADLDLRRSSPILIPSAQSASKYDDALHAKMESWSEFASWNHLNNESPYW